MKWFSLFGFGPKKKRKFPQQKAKKQPLSPLELLEERNLMANFSAGNLAVLRVGDGATTLSNAAAPVFIDEYSPTGTLVQSIQLPTAVNGVNKSLTLSGADLTQGGLTQSMNSQY